MPAAANATGLDLIRSAEVIFKETSSVKRRVYLLEAFIAAELQKKAGLALFDAARRRIYATQSIVVSSTEQN